MQQKHCLFGLPPLGTLHNLVISLSSKDGETGAQGYMVSFQIVELKQSREHGLKEFNFLCREEYFAVSPRTVSEAPVLTEFKTQAHLVAEKTS